MNDDARKRLEAAVNHVRSGFALVDAADLRAHLAEVDRLREALTSVESRAKQAAVYHGNRNLGSATDLFTEIQCVAAQALKDANAT